MTIGLNMIVKDEAASIKRCLDSILKYPLIDYWHIVDTGSTDGTQEIIKQYFAEKGIPGELTEFPFTNFAECRNLALAGLKGKCDYGLWADADDELIYSKNFNLVAFKKELSKYNYLGANRQMGVQQFTCIPFVKMSLNWNWHGYVHEYLEIKGTDIDALPHTMATGILINSTPTEPVSEESQQSKLATYAKLLEKQYADEPDNDKWLFYLGQTYTGMTDPESIKKGISFFDKRVAQRTEDFDEYAYLCKFYTLLAKRKIGEKPPPQSFIDCGKFNPYRIEHLLHVISMYQSVEAFEIAYIFSSYASKFYLKKPVHSQLFVDVTAYNFTCAYFHIINCLYTKRPKEGLNLFDVLWRDIKSGVSVPTVSEDEMKELKKELDATYLKK